MIKGRGFPDWPIAKKRERERALLREATAILRNDRRAQKNTADNERIVLPRSSSPEPVSRNGWVNIGLGDLKRVLRNKNGG